MSEIKHVAIIMDGNGRWAKQRLRPRIWGHVRGTSIVSSIVRAANEKKLSALTLYAFSTENWSRPDQEVKSLFKLLKKYLIRERGNILSNNIKFKIIGDISKLPKETISEIESLEKDSSHNTGLKLSFAFSYGGRAEIVYSVNSFIKNNPGKLIDEKIISENLYRPEISDVDLLIRTGGEKRLSNFLLWQMSYAELFFTETKWPDFSQNEFFKILEIVSTRDRRFGSLNNNGNIEETENLSKINIKNLFKEKKS